MIAIALDIKPDYVTLVPEKRQEVTTEGGIDMLGNFDRFCRVVERLQAANIPVSWFIDADFAQIQAAANTGAKFIELHTGQYAEAQQESDRQAELTIRFLSRFAGECWSRFDLLECLCRRLFAQYGRIEHWSHNYQSCGFGRVGTGC
jgi:pyridoxine 5'-phosphate synthase PdxJ